MAAPGRRTTLAFGIFAGLLTMARSTAASNTQTKNVFITDMLVPTFPELKSHGCLTEDFDYTHMVEVGNKCAQKVTADENITDCGNAPTVGLFNSCVTNGYGTTNADGTFFNISAFYAGIDRFTSDGIWTENAKRMLVYCLRASAANLMPRQQAVFTCTCWKWSLLSDCDNKQERNGTLSDAALLRRARFLSGSCPLSPIQLLDPFGMVTGRTWRSCSASLASGADAQQQYDAGVSRIACLLRHFKKADGNIDFTRLNNAISNRKTGAYDTNTKMLKKIVNQCTDSSVTPEALVKCWVKKGMDSCTYAEANQLAYKLPQTCAIFV